MARFLYFIEILGKNDWYSPRTKEMKGYFESYNDCTSLAFNYHRKYPKRTVRVVRVDMGPSVCSDSMFKVMTTY